MTLDTPVRFTLLGYPVGFAQPWSLLLAGVGLAAGLLGIWIALGRRRRVLGLITEDRFAARLTPGVSQLLPALQSGLYGVALLLFAIALGEPQCGSSSELTKRRGIDVVVALDASKSMLARDVPPSRLERAKLELSTLLDDLKGDRVGLVVFAGDAFIQCPLTSDYAAAKMFLRAVDPEQMQQGGTNIGEALELSKKVLTSADRGAKDRVIILLSDGEDLSGEIQEAVEGLKQENIKIFTVGIGSETGEPIPMFDRRGNMVGYQKDANGETVLTRLDRTALESLAQATGGEFFYAPRAVAMNDVAARVDKLQKSELESRVTVRYDERFQQYLIPGLLLLALGMLVPGSARRRMA